MISFWHRLGNQPLLQQIIDDYNQIHKDAQVQLTFVGSDYAAAVRASLDSSDGAPDLILAPEYIVLPPERHPPFSF